TDSVRAFAAVVAREHAELQHSIDSVATHLHLGPVMSALGQRIDSGFRARVDSLRAIGGAPLERAFAHEQVVSEQAIADYTDQLAGAVTAPELEALTESVGNQARAAVSQARTFEAAMIIADSTKAAAKADSVARADSLREAREARRRRARPPR
ncbi:MAG: DUF4142 domain-containing protein, partial [Gemmatimonadaceae bacterium]